MITLLKKGGKHVWEGLDDYTPITLLNTELKILSRSKRIVYSFIYKSIQDDLHLIREVLEEIKDITKATLISLHQSNAFDRVIHRFLETAGFQLESRRWISMMYHHPQAVVQVNGRRSRAFAIEHSVQQGYPLSPLLCLSFGAPAL